ncbi:MAG: hypothetical protein WDZ51_20030 [Pirellulaceae bacterium]
MVYLFHAIWMLVAVNQASAQLPTIELHALSQPAGQVGSTFQLTLLGTRTDEPRSLLIAGDPAVMSAVLGTGEARLLSESPTPANHFDITIAADASPGLSEVRALGRFGLSNPRKFLVTTKPVQLAAADHHDLATALPLAADQIMFDRCAPQKLNHYRVTMGVGTRLHAVAYAQAIDSRANLVVILSNAEGKELQRGYAIGNWPAEIDYEGPAGQEVFLAVHDLLYQGGTDYPYLLEAALAATGEQPPSLELNRSLRPNLSIAEQQSESADTTASDPAANQPPRTVPFVAEGALSPGQNDFDFTATAGQQLSIRVRSASAGQLTDPRVVVYRREGDSPGQWKLTQLAEQDDPPAVGRPDVRVRRYDPELVWTAPEEAIYRISVGDNQTGTRPTDAMRFAFSVGAIQPGFELLAYRPFPHSNPATARPFGTNLMLGGTEAVHVLARREDGYAGPITVAIEELPEGLTCEPMIIPAGQTEATLILRASEDAAQWQGRLSVVGRADIGEPPVEAKAQFATVVWSATPTRNAVEHRETGQLMAAVNTADIAPLLVELGSGTTTEIKPGEKFSLPIKATRREGAQAEIILRPQHLPPKVPLGEIRIPADQSEAAPELTIPADAPPGDYTWWMQVETKVKFKPNPQALAREEAYLAKLQGAGEVSTDETEKQQITEAVAKVSATIEELKKQTAEQDFTVWLPSTPHRIRIVQP